MYLFSNFGFEAGNVSLDLNTSDSKSELADSSIKTTHNEITTKNWNRQEVLPHTYPLTAHWISYRSIRYRAIGQYLLSTVSCKGWYKWTIGSKVDPFGCALSVEAPHLNRRRTERLFPIILTRHEEWALTGSHQSVVHYGLDFPLNEYNHIYLFILMHQSRVVLAL